MICHRRYLVICKVIQDPTARKAIGIDITDEGNLKWVVDRTLVRLPLPPPLLPLGPLLVGQLAQLPGLLVCLQMQK